MAGAAGHIVKITAGYQQQLHRTGTLIGTAAKNAWDGLGQWDQPDIARYNEQVAPVVRNAQLHAAALAAGFVAVVTQLPVSKETYEPDEIDWAPAFQTYWKALADGNDWADALTIGANIADSLGYDAIQSAARGMTGQIDRTEPTLTGWQRIPDGGACDWCLEVADQTYHSADSADFGHDRCACTVAPDI